LNLWKSYTNPEARVFQADDGEDLVILACTIFDWSTRVTDRRTDRQNCHGKVALQQSLLSCIKTKSHAKFMVLKHNSFHQFAASQL